MPILIKSEKNNVMLDTELEEIVVKGLRLLLLVGNDEETILAAKLMYLISQK